MNYAARYRKVAYDLHEENEKLKERIAELEATMPETPTD